MERHCAMELLVCGSCSAWHRLSQGLWLLWCPARGCVGVSVPRPVSCGCCTLCRSQLSVQHSLVGSLCAVDDDDDGGAFCVHMCALPRL